MKVALIFLSVAVAITHQLFQRQRERLWWNYYPSADPFFNIYHRIYQNLQDDSIQPEYYLFQPTRPITYPKEDEFNPNSAPEKFQDNIEEDEYPDVQSRIKIPNIRLPFFLKKKQPRQRLLTNYVNNVMTEISTVTLSLSQISIQYCAPSSNFVDAAAMNTPCRRKRDLLDSNDPEDTQFDIVPTETQRVMPTALPSLDFIRESRRAHQSLHKDIITSSKDVRDISDPASWMRNLSVQPRFLNFNLNPAPSTTVITAFSTSTMTTYSLVNVTFYVTKTVDLVNGSGNVICIPLGWIVCVPPAPPG